MTNPNAAMRMLIIYAVIIPVAILMGYLLTNPLDYGTIGFLGIIVAVLASPVFIKWHYPLMVFGLACPMTVFFLPGQPPLWEIMVIISLGIAVTERIMNTDKQFLRSPATTWPLLFIAAVVFLTMKLTGGLQLHALGGGEGGGGGKKYIALFLGVATYFALTSRAIPRNHWKLYLILFLLPSLLGMISEVVPILPGPLQIINFLFPPNISESDEEVIIGKTRLVSFSFAVGTIAYYMLARYGLRGILTLRYPWRALLFIGSFALTLLGGFRNVFGGFGLTLFLMFYLERLYRTRLLPVLLMVGVLTATLVATFSNQLPYTFQRAMCFLPLQWRSDVLLDAQGSSEWRFNIWRATWPKVPDHLLLGKGYGLSAQDYEMIGNGTFVRLDASHIDATQQALAISDDYHSGPLSTLMCFGVWGAVGMLWLMGATLFVLHRNYRLGDPELKIFNTYFLVQGIIATVFFLFVFGAFHVDVGTFAKLAGFSLAMNGGLARTHPSTVSNPVIKPKALPAGFPQPV